MSNNLWAFPLGNESCYCIGDSRKLWENVYYSVHVTICHIGRIIMKIKSDYAENLSVEAKK